MAELMERDRFSVWVHSTSAVHEQRGIPVGGGIDVVIPWWANSSTRAEIRRKLSETNVIYVREEAPPRNRWYRWYMVFTRLLIAFLITFLILKSLCAGIYSTIAVVLFSILISLLVALDDGVNNIHSVLTWIRIIHEVVLRLKQAYDASKRFESGDSSGPSFTVGSITRAI